MACVPFCTIRKADKAVACASQKHNAHGATSRLPVFPADGLTHTPSLPQKRSSMAAHDEESMVALAASGDVKGWEAALAAVGEHRQEVRASLVPASHCSRAALLHCPASISSRCCLYTRRRISQRLDQALLAATRAKHEAFMRRLVALGADVSASDLVSRLLCMGLDCQARAERLPVASGGRGSSTRCDGMSHLATTVHHNAYATFRAAWRWLVT